MDASYPAQSLNPPEAVTPDPGLEDLCDHCGDELAEIPHRFCSQVCAYRAGVLAEHQRCRDIFQDECDTDDDENGRPVPNLAMRLWTAIEGRS